MDQFVRHLVAQWCVQLPEYPTLRGPDVAAATRQAVLTFLRRVEGDAAAEHEARVMFRRRAASRAEEGMPLPILLRCYTIGARALFEQLCAAADRDEQAALPEVARLLLVSQDEAIAEVARAYEEELALLAAARGDRRRELVRDLVAGVAPKEPAALAEFGLDQGATVLALSFGEPADGAADAAVHRRLHRLHETIDAHFGGLVPVLLERGGGHVLVPRHGSASGGAEPAPPIGEDLVRRLTRTWGGPVHVAMSAAVQPEWIGAAARTADEILRLVCALGRAPGVYALQDVLLEYHLTRHDESADLLGGLLDPLAGRPDLLETLRVFLQEDYDRRRTAARLGLHPNTVDNRMARVTELTGLDPATPRGVALLMTTLALRDLR
ncbi:helix-turn-helix domain-containing protein [Actinocrinis puniceicyclus]|uniref:Helix-turn-helix domain-containing protein n=1 Tax=Actinocrinis puniceicyclus TaxID=977794 RepID=A0A8J8BAT7_9ACTN|nr:PucR family transcriptional regulator [Actinocrinis puniceicyclus]MBS2963307.1 helix-turn-helix domain-containing protein [Actinocrinis puniceicyclus]